MKRKYYCKDCEEQLPPDAFANVCVGCMDKVKEKFIADNAKHDWQKGEEE